MMKIFRLFIIILSVLAIIFGWFIADNNIIIKDNILHPRYVVKCLPENTIVKVAGYVQDILLTREIVLIKGKDSYPLMLFYNKTNLSSGDEIVALGYYDNNSGLFIVKKIYNGGYLFQSRYLFSLFVVPFIALIFFREYQFKNFRFVKRN